MSWPACGEIDIMEHGDGPRGLVSSTVHLQNADGNHRFVRGDKPLKTKLPLFTFTEWTGAKTELNFL